MISSSCILTSLAVAALLISACSTDPIEQPDAATDGDADTDTDFEIALPVLTPCPDGWEEVPPEEEGGVTTCDPWPGSSPVVMTPCPDGWREVEDDGVVTCDPWPEGGPHECAEDEAHFPGEPGCSLIGTECPDGNWAEDLPEDGTILYVLAGAPAGGEGTQDSPFGSIAEALDVAEEGTIVALSKGTFDEAVRLRNEITLWGACVAETVVANSVMSTVTGTISVGGRDTGVRNLQIRGERPGITVAASSSYSLRVEGVLIYQAYGVGLWMSVGSVTALGIVVRETRHLENGEQGGRGFEVLDGATVDVNRAVFERNHVTGVFASGSNTTLKLSNAAIHDTLPIGVGGRYGRGLSVVDRAKVMVSRAVLERNRMAGVRASDSGTTLFLTDVVVRDTESQESNGWGGRGLYARAGAEVEVSRASFVSNRSAGVYAEGPDTKLSLTMVAVRETRARAGDDRFGVGLSVVEGAEAEVDHTVFELNRVFGIGASDEGTVLHVRDTVVRETLHQEDNGEGGYGLNIREKATVVVAHTTFERNRDVGVVALSAGTTLNLTDVVVGETLSRECDGLYGDGMHVGREAEVEIVRAVFERNRGSGVGAFHEGTVLHMTDVVVRETQSRESDGQFGVGLQVLEGAQVEVSRAIFSRNREVGVSAFGATSTLSMVDVTLVQTLESECATDGSCSGYGDGILSQEGATIAMTDFVVSENTRCGVTVYTATMDLHDGLVSDNVIGACINAEGFDHVRLMDNVVFRDNERRLDPNFSMPVPEPALPSEWE